MGIALLTVLFLMSERRLLLDDRQNGVRQALDAGYSLLERGASAVDAAFFSQFA